MKKPPITILKVGLIVALVAVFIFLKRSDKGSFEAPGRDWNSPKKVEDYFVEKLGMTREEASEIRSKPGVDGTVDLRINTNVTLDGLTGNLYYYGFIKDEDTFRYALENTKDITPSENSIKVDNGGTI